MRFVWIFAIFASSWHFAAKWLWASAFPACLRCIFASLGSVETQEELHSYLAVALDVCLSFQHRVTECEDMWSEARLDGVHFRDMDRYQVYKSTKDVVLHIGTISSHWCAITSNWCAKTAFLNRLRIEYFTDIPWSFPGDCGVSKLQNGTNMNHGMEEQYCS